MYEIFNKFKKNIYSLLVHIPQYLDVGMPSLDLIDFQCAKFENYFEKDVKGYITRKSVK